MCLLPTALVVWLGVEAHEGSLIVTHTALTYAGVKCEHTTRSSLVQSFVICLFMLQVRRGR
jgi:hypothetical protein